MSLFKNPIPVAALIALFILLFACVSADENPVPNVPPNPVSQSLMRKVAAAKETLEAVDGHQLRQLMAGDKPFRLIDVRNRAEYDQGHIAGAEWFSRGTIDFDAMMGKLGAEHELYILYCKKGPRSILAAKQLTDMTYTNVKYLAGGFLGWIDEGNTVYNMHGEVKIVDFEKKEPK